MELNTFLRVQQASALASKETVGKLYEHPVQLERE